MMPDNDYTQMGSFIIYNPGNFETDTVIQIAGTASNGVTIKNKTNGDICKLKSLPDNGNYLEITSETGRIQMLPSYPDAVVYNYHDYGYIRLAPSWPVYDDITVTFTSGSNEITSSDFTFTKSFEGYYLFIDGGWYRISATYESTNPHKAVISARPSNSDTVQTPIVRMNEITITGEDAELTRMNIYFTPYVR